MHKSERRLPVHDSDRPRAMDRQVAYIGEGLIDPNGLEIEDIDIDESPQDRRTVLDSLAIDVGEKYLDDIYRENGNGGVNPAGGSTNEPREEPHANPYPPMVRTVERRTDKELAWLKVRQLLIEEEEKASTHKRPHTKSAGRSEELSKVNKAPCNTVKLLDSLAQSTAQHFSFTSGGPSEAVVNHPPQTFVDRMGSKFSQFMRGGTASSSDDESSNSTKSWRSNHSDSYSESVAPSGSSSSSNWMLSVRDIYPATTYCRPNTKYRIILLASDNPPTVTV